jgi:uncharacterized membrane protein
MSVVVVCCLAVGAVGGTTIDSTGVTSIEMDTKSESRTSESSSLQQLQQSNASTPETDIRVAVRANGSAVWTVQYRFRLDTPNETAAFDRLRADIASNSTLYQERFRQRITEAVASAERTTGREMAIENVSVRAARNGTTGVVTYEFVWRNFAVTDGNRIRLGDALAGLYLDNGTRLTISWPTEYETATIRPAPTDRRPNAVSWAGSTDFTGSEPALELVRSDSTTSGTGFGAEEGSNGAPASGSELPLSSIGLVALVLLVGGLGIVWFARQRRTADSTIGVVASNPDGSQETLGEGAPTTPDDTANPEPTKNPKPTENPEPAENDDRPSLDLLSNEERVVEVLKRSDGRAKQQQVVDELGWTDAKTSSVVSQLREDGTIEGFRLGRENVLQLPDEEPENDTDDTTNDV